MIHVLQKTRPDYFFFFQAEDGIRDGRVTGVQTCALPISESGRRQEIRLQPEIAVHQRRHLPADEREKAGPPSDSAADDDALRREHGDDRDEAQREKIGRASCRERGEISVGAVALKEKTKE